ncbi:MAG TPA: pyridoxamine 5'-phosphate oxidase family protein [Mycobacteriales bacterium]
MAVPPEVARDHAGLEVLPYEECLRLAGLERVGRLAFAQAGGIEVLPVNHVVVGTTIAFRSAPGSKLDAAMEVAVVAFEVDHYDPLRRTGWSVLFKGRVEEVTDPVALARLRSSALQPWNERIPRPHWMVVRPDTVTGRRL